MSEPEAADPDTIDIPASFLVRVFRRYSRALLGVLGGMLVTMVMGGVGAYGEVKKIPGIEADIASLKVQQQQLALNAWVACAMLTQLHQKEKAQVEHDFSLKLDCSSPLGVKTTP